MDNIIYTLTSLAINVADALIAGAFFIGFMGSLYSGKKKYLGYALFAILYSFPIVLLDLANTSAILTNGEEAMLAVLPMITFGYLYNLFFTKGSPLRKLLPLIIFFLLLMIINFTLSFAVSLLNGLFLNVPLNNIESHALSVFDFAFLTIDKIALFYVTQSAVKFINKDNKLLKPKELLAIYLSPIFTIIIIILLLPLILSIDNVVLNLYFIIAIVLLFASSLITYHLYVRTIKNNKSALQLERMKQQQEYEKRYYAEQTKKYDEIRTIRHNMKNQLLYLQTAIKEERNNEATKFINKFTQNIENTGDFIRTDNYAFNCILNAMIAEAKESDIRVKVQIIEHIDITLDSTDASVILGNLLENAIEACNKLNKDKRKIIITIEQNLIGLMIRIGNSTGVSVIKENPDFLTDKHDKEQHGLGVKSVRKIVQKYDGLMTCHEEEDVFYWTLFFKKSADLV